MKKNHLLPSLETVDTLITNFNKSNQQFFVLNSSSKLSQGHPYHLVDLSPWPLQTSITLGTFVGSFVLTFAQFNGASLLLLLATLSLIVHMSLWFSDVVAEGSLNGDHTSVVMRGLVLGMSLFIVTELLFFVFIFWTYLHSSLSPVVELGCDWPPLGIDPLDAKAIPTLNTALLLSSGKICAANNSSLYKFPFFYGPTSIHKMIRFSSKTAHSIIPSTKRIVGSPYSSYRHIIYYCGYFIGRW